VRIVCSCARVGTQFEGNSSDVKYESGFYMPAVHCTQTNTAAVAAASGSQSELNKQACNYQS
jgi:hypothetical protein